MATHATKERPSDVVLGKLKEAVCGADMPADEEAHSARDTQFELYVWGMFNAAGSQCYFVEPPDLVCNYGEEKVGIAVKRVWSLDQTKKRLSRAADQIADAKLRGFIAISAQEFLTAESAVADLGQKGIAFNREVSRLHGHFPYLAKKPHVLGVVVTGATYRWDVPDEGQVSFAVSVYHQDIIWADGEEEEKLVSDFTTRRLSGLREWMRDNL